MSNNKIMNILLVSNSYPGKNSSVASQFVRQQALALEQHDYNIVILALEVIGLRRLKKKNWFLSLINGARLSHNKEGLVLHVPILRIPFLDQLNVYIWKRIIYKAYKKYIKPNFCPDLIHAHFMIWGGVISGFLSQKEEVPFLVTEHSTSYQRALLSRYQKQLIAQLASHSSANLCVSPSLSKEFLKVAGPVKTIIVPNLVDTEVWTPNKVSSKERDACSVVKLLTIALIEEKKGIDVLLHSFKLALELDNNIELIIGGSGSLLTHYKNLAAQLGITDNVTFLGLLTHEQVKFHMGLADAFILLSRVETFGVVFIEAMSMGLPVIATRCGGPEEFVDNNNGILLEIEKIDQSAQAINEMVVRVRSNYYNSEHIRKKILNTFSKRAVIRKLSGVYDAVLGRASGEN